MSVYSSFTESVAKSTFSYCNSVDSNSQNIRRYKAFLSHVEQTVDVIINILGMIGRGKFGQVFKVKVSVVPKIKGNRTSTDVVMALKIVGIKEHVKRNEEIILRKISGRHINLISMKYYIIISSRCQELLLMDYMPENLSNLVERMRFKKFEMCNELVKLLSRQLFSGLEYLHQLNIAHRDIKPCNILVNANELLLKIADFGSAKVIIPGEKNAISVGTRYYKAPEILLKNAEYTESVDIWSAGCVVAYLCTQKTLMNMDNDDELKAIYQVIGDPRLKKTNTNSNDDVLNKLISDTKLQILTRLILKFDFKERITAEDILKSEYFN